ncbi:MAG TPA: DUF4905 domain-containing protein, partial [Candidatus Kapabacteria bacterium]|nr:DUF4905 domain-containing protein [Candidatus Kapabacteria bacterium]
MNSHTNFQAAEGNAITRLLINRNGLIVGEERDPETNKASLFAVDITRDSSLWSNVTIDEPWWFGLIDLTDEAAYLQRYAEGPLPTAAGVTAIDLSSGRVLWSLPRVAYHQEAAGEVILLQQGILQQQYFAVDSRTGEHIRKINVEDLPPRTETDLRHLSFPSVIAPDETSATETLS